MLDNNKYTVYHYDTYDVTVQWSPAFGDLISLAKPSPNMKSSVYVKWQN